MADAEQVHQGTLSWNAEKKTLGVLVPDPQRPGRTRLRKIKPQYDLGPDLKDRDPAELDGLEVDYTPRKGTPTDVRPRGTATTRKALPEQRKGPRARTDAFLNPYTFVPAGRRPSTGPFADAPPAGHDRLREGLWTGTLRARLTVATPLLLLDPSRATPSRHDQDHLVHPVLSREGRPHLPATSLKGMLRSAYEAVTNSRFGVFNGHEDRLAHRMASTESQYMVPARVSEDGRRIVLLPGDTPPGGQAARNPLLHAAWLPRYRPKATPVTYPGGRLPQHGDPVVARVRRRTHRSGRFSYWQVEHIVEQDEQGLPVTPLPPAADPDTKVIHGWVCVNNENINRKHDERVFFEGDVAAEERELDPALRVQWRTTINNYLAAHRTDDLTRRPHDPNTPDWSRHLDKEFLDLVPGSLCYAQMAGDRIVSLQPVMIGRALFDKAPAELLPRNLHPAATLAELSPADRVFGWVAPSGQGAHRGQLRIGPVEPGDDAAFEDFGEDGFPLAVLGQPKPQQARFYVAGGAGDGSPLPERSGKKQWYTGNQTLRGRKAYWHHRGLSERHWEDPVEDRTQTADDTGRFQEYRRPDREDGKHRDKQNRSVRGWVRPGSTFTFTIDVTNLTDVELGALVWLLGLPDEHYLRLGLGKPLGFGSVRLELDPHDPGDVRTGEEWADAYRSLSPDDDNTPQDTADRLELVREVFTEEAKVLGKEDRSPLSAFLRVAHGIEDVAVHYPRIRPDGTGDDEPVGPDPDGENFRWFTANEQLEDREVHKKAGRSLPPVWREDPVLPYHPKKHEKQSSQQHRSRSRW